jgi:hypothetical protein
MKRFILIMLIVSGYCYGQENEFKTYSNGLIYDQSTMHKLEIIVDSLNVKFRSCDLAHPYYSHLQGMAIMIEVPNKAARKMIEDGVSFVEYTKRYPRSIKKDKLWIVKTAYKDYNGKPHIEYSGLPFGWSSEPSIQVKDKKANDKTSGWVLDEEDDLAFYLEKLTKQELPFDYARLVQYVDCMIDTTAEIYFPQAKGSVYQRVDKNSKANQFITWAEKFPNKPEFPDYDKIDEKQAASIYSEYYKKHSIWDSLRIIDLDAKMKTATYWKDLLAEAAAEGFESGGSDAQLEFYVSRYLSKEQALKLMRSRRVVGNCSMDQSPRYHAMNICKLSAETAKWDIFLRSHLDIMNDRFERQSDGSYALAGRKTYLKELEELDIPAIDLLLGTSLRVDNVSDKHYRGSISRVGRALADASDKDQLEKRLIAMIKDEKLDPYNRLLMAYLFNNYAENLEDESRKNASKRKLEGALKLMPEYVRTVWAKE